MTAKKTVAASAFSLLWLPQVLRDAGLTVVEVPGWKNRGHGDEGKVLGVLCHHTCGPLHGDLPDLNVLVDGRPDLGGPLCNLGLGRNGTYYMIAAGKAWHAGAGLWQGVRDGNAHFIGIEAENTGETKGARADTWPAVQMDAYRRGVAAILKHIGAASIMCAGHKEYALPHGRKDDPDFDMEKFRADVATLMAGGQVETPLSEVADFELQAVQQRLKDLGYAEVGIPNGKPGSRTVGALSAFQSHEGLPVTGLYDDATKARLAVAEPREVSDDRANATVDDLRAAGSQTVAAADNGSVIAKLLALLGLGGGATKLGVVDQAQQAVGQLSTMGKVIEGAKEGVAAIAPYWPAFALAIGVYLTWNYRTIIMRRLADHISGVHAGR